MDSPPTPNSPSPSTPSSGDEESYPAVPVTSVNNTSPAPKRRAVAAPGRNRRAGTGGGEGGKQGGQQERKEELVDVAYMNDLRALIGDPFDDTILTSRS